MAKKTDKKIFSQTRREYTLVKAARSYIEYYIPACPGSNVLVRKRHYAGLNFSNDTQIEDAALKIIAAIEARETPVVTRSASVLEKRLEAMKKDLRPKTYQTYWSRLRPFLLWLNGRSPDEVTPEMAQEFLNHCQAAGKHTTTVNSYRNALITLYKAIGTDPAPFQFTKKFRKNYRSLMWLSDAQIHTIKPYAQAVPQLWETIQLLSSCFIRPKEQRGLLIGDIYPGQGFIEIRSEISKNKKTQRVVIPNHLISMLQSYVNSYPGHFFMFGAHGVPGLKPVSRDHFYKKHKDVLKLAKITGRYSLYSWKHTGVVKAVRAGINIKDLQLQLRHHSLDMVNEYLKNLGVMDSKDLRDKLPEF